LYIVIVLTVSRFLILKAFTKLEMVRGIQQAEKVDQCIKQELMNLDTFTLDWSSWDETWNFVAGQNPDFNRKNLPDETFTNSKINFLAVLDSNNKVLSYKLFDHNMNRLPSLSNDLANTIERKFLYTASSDTAHKEGLIQLEDNPMMIVSRPILHSDNSGPILGYVIVGRYLNVDSMNSIPTLNSFNIKGFRLDKAIPDPIDQEYIPLATQTKPVVTFTDNKMRITYGVLNDINNKPIFAFKIFTEPEILNLGKSTVGSFMLIFFFFTFVIIYVSVTVLDRKILSRLVHLQNDVIQIRKDGDFTKRVEEEGRDEISSLESQINSMLASLQESHNLLEATLQDAQSATKTKSEFLANMSHEIRTPLNGIIGAINLIDQKELNTEQQNLLEIIHFSSNSLLNLINDILDYSKLEVGKMEFDNVAFNLRDLVESIIDSFAIKAYQKNIELLSHMSPETIEECTGDPYRLHQILNNLISNAVKFTDKGEVHLLVEMLDHQDHMGMFKFQVTDTGIGIADDKIAEIFESFKQADGSITRRYGGTGLGLPIAKQIIELMGGKVSVTSKINGGTTFEFEIPLWLKSLEPLARKLDSEQINHSRILIVDDNMTNRHILSEILKSYDFRFAAVGSGKKAIQKVKEADEEKRPFDVILMDVQMPEMDGFVTISKIKELELSKQPKIAILTSVARKEDLQKARELGIHKYLQKPVKMRKMILLLRELILGEHQPSTIFGSDDSSKAESTEMEPMTIMIAEDNVINLKIAVRMLEKMGHRVLSVNNGEQAVEMYSKYDIDLVLMDVQMPVMDGFEATKMIRNIEKKTGKFTPILALTAHALAGHREACIEKGLNDFIAKPITFQALYEVINQYRDAKKNSKISKSHSLTDLKIISSTQGLSEIS
jgi:signal transduction histidine kinase/CheY-like chemotaxis protein